MRGPYDIYLALCEHEGEFLPRIPSDVAVVDLKCHLRGRINLGLVPKVAELSRALQPDILISFHGITNIGSYLGAKLVGSRAKIVGCVPGEVMPGRLNFIRKQLYRRLDAAVCVSQGVESSLRKYYGVGIETRVIPNCVDVQRILERSNTRPEHSWLTRGKVPVGVTVSRLIRSKGTDIVIKAAVEVNKRRGFRLLIIGDGPERVRLERLICELHAGTYIQVVGYQDNPLQFLSMADVFLFASSAGEGLPTVLIEAMICRVPIVSAPYMGGNGEIIANGVTGILLEDWNYVTMAGAIEMVLDNPEQVGRMVKRAYSMARSNFDKGAYLRAYMSLFSSLLATENTNG